MSLKFRNEYFGQSNAIALSNHYRFSPGDQLVVYVDIQRVTAHFVELESASRAQTQHIRDAHVLATEFNGDLNRNVEDKTHADIVVSCFARSRDARGRFRWCDGGARICCSANNSGIMLSRHGEKLPNDLHGELAA